MANKALTLIALLLLANTVWAQTADESEQSVDEEILVTAPGGQTPEPPPLLKRPDWQISDKTRIKLELPVQIGYDPQVEQILGDKQVPHRGQMGETQPVTVLRAKF